MPVGERARRVHTASRGRARSGVPQGRPSGWLWVIRGLATLDVPGAVPPGIPAGRGDRDPPAGHGRPAAQAPWTPPKAAQKTGRWGRIPVDCGIALSQCPGPLSICWTGGHGRSNTPGADSLVQSASPGVAVRRNQAQGDPVATRSTKLAKLGRYVMADHRRDAGRPDERARPGSALRRRDAEAVVDQQHDADVRHVLGRARRLGAVGLQDGVRHPVPRRVAQRLFRELHRETRTRAVAHRAAAPGEHPVDR